MAHNISLETMSVPEKIQLLEQVWDDLCRRSGDVQAPDWHKEVLAERRQRLEDGRATISSWEDAKARLMRLGQ